MGHDRWCLYIPILLFLRHGIPCQEVVNKFDLFRVFLCLSFASWRAGGELFIRMIFLPYVVDEFGDF